MKDFKRWKDLGWLLNWISIDRERERERERDTFSRICDSVGSILSLSKLRQAKDAGSIKSKD
jgi:hypothetical protein